HGTTKLLRRHRDWSGLCGARSLQLVWKTTEPRRQQQQFIDLVRRDLSSDSLRGRVDLVDLREQLGGIRRAGGNRHLGADVTTANEIDAVVAGVAWNVVDEREILHGESQPLELRAKRLQAAYSCAW